MNAGGGDPSPLLHGVMPGARLSSFLFFFPQGGFRCGSLIKIPRGPEPPEVLHPPGGGPTVWVHTRFPDSVRTLRDRPGLLSGGGGPLSRSPVGCVGSGGSVVESGTIVPGGWLRFLNLPSGCRSQVWAYRHLLIGSGTAFSCSRVLGAL
jgi:hypothetical protein